MRRDSLGSLPAVESQIRSEVSSRSSLCHMLYYLNYPLHLYNHSLPNSLPLSFGRRCDSYIQWVVVLLLLRGCVQEMRSWQVRLALWHSSLFLFILLCFPLSSSILLSNSSSSPLKCSTSVILSSNQTIHFSITNMNNLMAETQQFCQHHEIPVRDCQLVLNLYYQNCEETFRHRFNHTHPIILIGLPKSGTTSVSQFLHNFNILNIHQAIGIPSEACDEIYPLQEVTVDHDVVWRSKEASSSSSCHVSELIQAAISQQKDPLHYLFKHEIFAVTQLDSCVDSIDIWPQIDSLSYLLKAYPQAYYVHTIRNTIDHAKSILNWGNLSDRIESFGHLNRFAGQSPQLTKEENLLIFIDEARKIVRQTFLNSSFAQSERGKWNYLELDVSEPCA
jgi:hypothetical protein